MENINFYVDDKKVNGNDFKESLKECLLNNMDNERCEKYLNTKLNEMKERKVKKVGWYLKNHYLRIELIEPKK